MLDKLESDLEDYVTISFQRMLQGLYTKHRTLGSTSSREQSNGARVKASQHLSAQSLSLIAESAIAFCNSAEPMTLQLKESLCQGFVDDSTPGFVLTFFAVVFPTRTAKRASLF